MKSHPKSFARLRDLICLWKKIRYGNTLGVVFMISYIRFGFYGLSV